MLILKTFSREQKKGTRRTHAPEYDQA